MTPTRSAEEINEAVAKRLGWKPDPPHGWINPKPHKEGFRIGQVVLPNFCTHIEAAFECLGDREWRLEQVMIHPADRETKQLFWCSIRTGFSEWANAQADTAPMAIALAFLKLPPTV